MPEPAADPEYVPAVVVGGGQAGLAVSWHLKQSGIQHVVLERDTLMHSWRDARWDSFCLVTPNWQCRLPGYEYAGDDPHGFMVAAELREWLAGYVASFGPPVREHTPVLVVRAAEHVVAGTEHLAAAERVAAGTEHLAAAEHTYRFEVTTPTGMIRTDQIVVATGGYHDPAIPRIAERFGPDIVQVHSSQYRNSESLPPGAVLVVGTGQSGAQIAEDLMLAGRQVHLAVGGAPRTARSYRGRDVVAWLHDMGHYDRPVTDRPVSERHRDRTNHYVTGRDGGRDIDLREFAMAGMRLHGHLSDVEANPADNPTIRFALDLAHNLDAADAVYNGINAAIDSWITEQGIATSAAASRYQARWEPPTLQRDVLPVAELAAIVWATGFTRDYRWLELGVFDGAGHVVQHRGVTAVQGLYFVGLPWLHTWGSGRFAGVARDAGYVAEQVRLAHDEPGRDHVGRDHLRGTDGARAAAKLASARSG